MASQSEQTKCLILVSSESEDSSFFPQTVRVNLSVTGTELHMCELLESILRCLEMILVVTDYLNSFHT